MRTRQELINDGIRYRDMPLQGAGRPKYPIEDIKEVFEAIDKDVFSSRREYCELTGITESMIAAWKQRDDFKINVRTVSHGKSGIRHALSTKIQACERVADGASYNSVAKSMGIGVGTIMNWYKDYESGLYALEHVTQVSRKKFKTYDVLVKELDNLEKSIIDKKQEIRQALEQEYKEKLAKLST